MKTRNLDKNLKSFIYLSFVLALVVFLVLVGFGFTYRYSTLNTYNYILLIIIILIIILLILFVLSTVMIFYVYLNKRVAPAFLRPLKFISNFIMPPVIALAGFFGMQKDAVRGIYININNVLSEPGKRKYGPEDILVVLPHCLQNSDCSYKITNDIFNCKKCGKCCVGDIVKVAQETGVKVRVVTGGTAARNIISKEKPKIVISVACERDLASGIADVTSIPVIGIINERPNGPCHNTTVDVSLLKAKIDNILSDC